MVVADRDRPPLPAWCWPALVTFWRLTRACSLTVGLALALMGGLGLWALMDASTYVMLADWALKMTPDEMHDEMMNLLFKFSHFALSASFLLMFLWVCFRGPGYLVADEWVYRDIKKR